MVGSIISEESPKRLLELIRMGHPNRTRESYGRGEVIEEIRRRHVQIFEALGWPRTRSAIYKNRYTARELTLESRYERWKEVGGWRAEQSFSEWFQDSSPFILEHWYPVELWEPSAVHSGVQYELFHF